MTLDECAQVALRVRERLQARGLDALPVTSGSKGIHLYAGVGDGWTSRRCPSGPSLMPWRVKW